MSNYTGLEIAIIGFAGRFPGAGNVHSFWDNLKNGVESIRFFSDEELRNEGEQEDMINHPQYVKAYGLLHDKEYFDSAFFNYRPDEATLMDPQIRLFHECVWQAMEDAGCDPADSRNKIGVFAGSATSINWSVYSKLMNRKGLVDEFSASQLSNARFLASRVSYFLDLRGPSIFIDTTCSTSLVAIQQACKSLLLVDCNVAVAGGITIANKSKRGYLYQDGMILSQDGHCRAFDADSSGTVEGEGGAVVVLKTLKNALRDRDNIWAIIKGYGMNNDGNNKVGYTAPSVSGQTEAIMMAQKRAKVEPESITYVEAHGTGTKLGDVIEVEALNRVFGKSKERYCALGSVKSNVGHLDMAAGVAGLIKTVLALKHKQIPPSLHFKEPNPEINFTESPFYVNTQLQEWRSDKYPLRAGVSSFGMGGTNVHVILEEAPKPEPSSESRTHQLLLFSAKTPSALERNLRNFGEYLKANGNINLADAAFTLKFGRIHFAYRKMLVCKHAQEAIDMLADTPVKKNSPVSDEENHQVIFMFSGQGSQYINMCLDLYRREPVFKEEADRCFKIVKEQSGKDLKSVIFASRSSDGPGTLDNTEFTQPALFIVEYALARVLMKWGINPDCMIGHSIGEYVAACISGVFTLEDALRLVTKRGQLMQQVTRGTMLSISISEKDLHPLLATHTEVSLAAVNSSELCVVSGKPSPIDKFKNEIETRGYKCRVIRTSHAFHSQMMEEVLGDFKKEVARIQTGHCKIPFVSNLTGEQVTDLQVSQPQYWVNHLRQTVLFSKGIETLFEKKAAIFIEIGPGKSLSTFVRSNQLRSEKHKVVSLVRHSQENGDDLRYLLSGLGEMWLSGIRPDWNAFYENQVRRKVSLPSYSFDKIKYPVTVDAFRMVSEMTSHQSLLNGNDLSGWFHFSSWQMSPTVPVEQPPAGKCNVIFLDAGDFAQGLGKRFTRQGEDVVYVKKGPGFAQENDSFRIDPQSAEDYGKVFSALESEDALRIIFAWGVTRDVPEKITTNGLKESLDSCFYSLLHIAKAADQKKKEKGIEIIAITNNVQSVLKGDVSVPAKSPVLGALKVIPKEFHRIKCRNIDITLPQEETADVVFDEIASGADDNFVAFRHQTRFTPVLKPVRLQHQMKPAFVDGGVYLITGGTGGMGLFFAQKIAANARGVKLVILGRTPLPTSDAWKTWLENENNRNPLYPIVEKLVAMQASGAEIHYSTVDITDRDVLDKFLHHVAAEKGRIRGVIHAAGIADYAGVIYRRTQKDNEKIFAAKVYGTVLLGELLLPQKPDFFVMCSSSASVYAPFGQVGYVAANIFMDSFSRQCAAMGNDNVISIGWNAWKDLGMAVKAARKNNEDVSPDSISPEDGYEVLLRAVGSRLPHMIISKVKSSVLTDKTANVNTDLKVDDPEDVLALPSAEDASQAPSGDIMQGMAALWQAFFGKPDIDADADFFDIGGDSLKALTLTGRIHKTFDVEISLTEFFDNSTIRKLSARIKTAKIAQGDNGNAHDPIPKAPEKPYYRLSSAQKRLYFLYELDRTSTAYNMPFALQLRGALDRERLRSSFSRLVTRHESLRTVFGIREGEPVQRILDEADFELDLFSGEEREIQSLIQKFIRPFDLEKGPLFRVGLIEVTQRWHILMVDMHHIIADGVSHGILTNDFMAFYKGDDITALELQYKDYAEWQNGSLQQEHIARARDFWMAEFAEEPAVLHLPADFARPTVKSYNGSSWEFWLDDEITAGLKSMAERESTTMFMVMLSLYNILLSKLSGQNDIVIGTPAAARQHVDLQKIMGMFVNTIPLRNNNDGNQTFREFLATVRSRTLASFDNQQYPYEVLIDDLKVTRATNRNPLFDAMFTYLNFETFGLEIPDLTLEPYTGSRHEVSQFDLNLWVREAGNRTSLRFEYSTDLFTKETIRKFAAYFENIARSVASDTNKKIAAIGLITGYEQSLVLNKFNESAVSYPGNKTIHAVFEDIVLKRGDSAVITFEGKTLSYHELNESSNRLARKILRSLNEASEENIVGILMPRASEMLISILAVLKAGYAYLPIDPEYPMERIRYIAEDSRLRLILTTPSMASVCDQLGAGITIIDVTDGDIAFEESTDLKLDIPSSRLAYLIYTSGSTGNPKGVMVEHRNVVNFVYGVTARIGFSNDGTILCLTTVSFDIFVLEAILPLLNGMKIVLAGSGDQKDPNALARLIIHHEIGFLQITPSHLKLLISGNSSLTFLQHIKVLMVGGEAFSAGLLAELKNKYRGKIYNMYGPTETTVWSMIKDLTSADAITIGKPIANTTVYIMDRNGMIQPQGVAGELCIGGEGVSRGYWMRPELTRERFGPGPRGQNEIVYRTGDLAKWLPDGEVAFLGRKDHQVKIRGYRIETGEVENHLLKHELISEAVVAARGKETDQYLAAYYVSDNEIKAPEIRSFLLARLPEYMVPSHFIHLQHLPLTPNGKLNRKALPEPEMSYPPEYVAPENDLERVILDMWQQVLKQDNIGTNADFFLIGGNSFKLIELFKLLDEHFPNTIKVMHLFEHRTVSDIAAFIGDHTDTKPKAKKREKIKVEF